MVQQPQIRKKSVGRAPDLSTERIVRAFKRHGYELVSAKRHITMRKPGSHPLSIPRHNPVDGMTLGRIIADAGLTLEEFNSLV